MLAAGPGYVEQFDTLLPELTVREMLLYTAELKCPRAEPLPAKRARVEQLLGTLALGGCAGTLIGDALARGISGGQVSAPPPLLLFVCVLLLLGSACPGRSLPLERMGDPHVMQVSL